MISHGQAPKEIQKSDASNNKELFRVKGVRLLDFFPDELVIQEKTVSVIKKDLLSTYVQTMSVQDVIEVGLMKSGIFASLIIYSKFPGHQLEIKNLSMDKASKAKEIIDRLLQNLNRSG